MNFGVILSLLAEKHEECLTLRQRLDAAEGRNEALQQQVSRLVAAASAQTPAAAES